VTVSERRWGCNVRWQEKTSWRRPPHRGRCLEFLWTW